MRKGFGSSLSLALTDLLGGFRNWSLWGSMGWQDIRQRYRRSLLGPLWISISMGILLLTLGLLYGRLFHQDISVYLPYLTAGLVAWNLISVAMAEGATAFIEAAGFIKQVHLPYSTYVLRVLWRTLIISLHNFGVFVLAALAFGLAPSWNSLLLIPALALVLLNALWLGLILALISTRYRDVPQMVTSLLQPIFFFTPIIWTLDQIGDRTGFVHGNPIYHLVEILRAPMLSQVPGPESWAAAVVIALGGFSLFFLVYARYRSRISYWI